MPWPQTTARLKPDGDLVELPVGGAEEVRRRMQAGQRYFCPACDEPFAYPRGRSRRDHFVHPSGQAAETFEHAMTAAHFDAQVMLRRWAHAQGLDAALEQVVEDGVRRADVLVTFPTGAQVALEVQHSGLTEDHWQQRHQDYRLRGIADIWLWIHKFREGRRVTRASRREPTGWISVAQHAAVRAGLPALWVLLDERVATGYTGRPYQEELDLDRLWLDKYWWLPERLERTGLRAPDQTGEVTVAIDPLAACTLTPKGIHTPMLARIQTERDALHRLAAPSQQQAQRALKLLAAARGRVQARLLPRVYTQLAAPDGADGGVRAPGADVRAWVYETVRGHLAAAGSVSVDDLVAQCRATGVVETRNRGVERVVTRFLTGLRDLRIITVHAPPSSVPGRPQQYITRGPRFHRWERDRDP